ncbi:hypothetical protein GTU79_13730 [Sodalis ligni]|uniref:hypothetical protein n=1 Tax=Sodalis ligni TaxID=2697027 RepID=UPI00193F2433|nr:hypothetical protein [Sodalis ligni]QWA13543.1 hypothetical protein GTU79_13730 [Sodalis ligni]
MISVRGASLWFNPLVAVGIEPSMKAGKKAGITLGCYGWLGGMAGRYSGIGFALVKVPGLV